MALWMKCALSGIGLVVVGTGLAIWVGSNRWNDDTAALVRKLVRGASQNEAAKISFENFDQLPVPVARYLRLVLKEGRPLVRSARIEWDGEFRVGDAEDGWSAYAAKQYFSSRPVGFVWDASIRMAPLIDVRVRDAYVDGRGMMRGKILSLVPVVDESGKAELNEAALQRYLAEAVWFPTALLPGQGVQWSAIDDRRALATLTDGNTTVSLEFRFSETGEIEGVYSPGRYREVNGAYELTPWAGRYRDYGERNGMRVPLSGEVEWRLPGGNLPYWRGRVVGIDYQFTR